MWRRPPTDTAHDHSWCFVDRGEALINAGEVELDGRTYCILLDSGGGLLVSATEYALSRAR